MIMKNLVFKNLMKELILKVTGDGEIREEIIVKSVCDGYEICRKFRNVSDRPVFMTERVAVINGLDFGCTRENDYFYCVENARLYGSLTIPVDADRINFEAPVNKKLNFYPDSSWAEPEVTGKRILASPYQPFPALLIGNYETEKGLVIGSLCQDVFFHNFELEHSGNKIVITIFSSFKDIKCRRILPSEELTDVFYIGETCSAANINSVFNGYTKALKERLTNNFGSKKTNRHTLIWDSWNDGIYRDVSEKMLLEEAQAVRKYFPNVEFFQLDDGYSAFCDKNVDLNAHGLGTAYEKDGGTDMRKFPEGLKGFADKVRRLGLRPAIWIGGLCPTATEIYKEHSDWFIDYSYRIKSSQPLDVSNHDARKYMTYAIDKIVAEAGFEGVKHDFWSYSFEDSHDLLANGERSGYEWRNWWHRELRKRLPENGYLETGCDVSMGNPFIGRYFNNYRFGLDIGAGKWKNILITMFWSVPVLSTHSGDLFIPNSDSIGLLPGLDDKDFMFVVNFQIITRTLVEISGRFSKVCEDDPRLKILKKAISYLNNGENVYFAKYDYRKSGFNLPRIIYIKSIFDIPDSYGNVRTVAVFNTGEDDLRLNFSATDLGLEGKNYCFRDVWSEEMIYADVLEITLKPHESRLFTVC